MDNSYIQTLIDNGEYDELLTFLLTVLPGTRVELDSIEECIKLYIGQAEYIDEMDETITEFKLRVSKLKKHKNMNEWDSKKWSTFMDNYIKAASNEMMSGLTIKEAQHLLWITQGLRQVGIRLEAWQKEDLRNIFMLQIKKNRE